MSELAVVIACNRVGGTGDRAHTGVAGEIRECGRCKTPVHVANSSLRVARENPDHVIACLECVVEQWKADPPTEFATSEDQLEELRAAGLPEVREAVQSLADAFGAKVIKL